MRQAIISATVDYTPSPRPRMVGENWNLDQLEPWIETLVDTLNLDSSPGWPWMDLDTTNYDLVVNNRDLIVSSVCKRIRKLSSSSLSRYESFLDGRVDLVRLFVKQEPHPTRKIVSKRWRLIFSVSVVDQLVERALYYNQCKSEIDRWEHIPSKPGIGFGDLSMDSINSSVELLLPVVDTDMSGWDMNVKCWMLRAAVATHALASGVPFHSDFGRVMRGREELAMNPYVMFSDGKIDSFPQPGRMMSGRFVTSMFNSHIRVLLASMRGCSAIAMGDDCVEQLGDGNWQQFYESLGFTVTGHVHEELEGVEFCSHVCRGRRWVPLSLPRMVFRYISKREPTHEEAHQLLFEVRHHPLYDKLRDYLMSRLKAVEPWWLAQNDV